MLKSELENINPDTIEIIQFTDGTIFSPKNADVLLTMQEDASDKFGVAAWRNDGTQDFCVSFWYPEDLMKVRLFDNVKYTIHYHDDRLSNPYKCIEINTSDIDKWKRDFVQNNTSHITIMECYTA